MAIAGIEGLAQGFMQGMAIKRQNDRQDVLDAQNLERFNMDKERFATQQAASAFELQNAQTNAANAAIDRTRALGIQKKGDEFEANLGRIFGAGAPENQLMELEKVHQANGVKGAFARDPKTGGLAKSADGKFQWVNEGGSTENVTLEDSIGRYIAKVDPKGEFTRKRTQQDELAKEKRDLAKEIKLGGIKHAQAKELEGLKSRNQRALLEERGKLKDPKKYLSKPTQDSFYDVQETIDPYSKQKTFSKPIFNQDRYDDFMLFSHAHNLDPDDNAYRLWRKSTKQVAQQPSSTSPTSGLNAAQTQKTNSALELLKTKTINNENDMASAIKELRAKKFTDEQINAAFDELGL